MEFAFEGQPDRADLEGSAPDGRRLVMRPVTSPAAAEIARQLLEAGAPGVELRPDGSLWALGVDRRRHDNQDA